MQSVRAFIAAAEHGDTFAAELLISAGADVNAASASGDTALRIAIGKGDSRMASLQSHSRLGNRKWVPMSRG